jgi:maleate isomerase
MNGWRARIGLITTSVNTVNEPEFYRTLPTGVSVHTSRLPFFGKTTVETTDEMNEGIGRCAELLETADVDVVVYGVTAGSFYRGLGYDTEIEEQIESDTGVPAVAAAASLRRAAAFLDLERLAIATPYIEEFNDRLRTYLEGDGFEVVAMDGLGIEEGVEIGAVTPQQLYQEVTAIDRPEADGILISGTNYRTFEAIDPLEADLEKPVISANAAELWDALRTLGLDTTEIEKGQLFEEKPGR